LLSEEEKYKEIQRKFLRARRLLKTDNVSRSKYEEVYFLYFRLKGQKKKVKQLAESVEVLKHRSEQSNEVNDDGSPKLAPILTTIDLSKSKIARLRTTRSEKKSRSRLSRTHRKFIVPSIDLATGLNRPPTAFSVFIMSIKRYYRFILRPATKLRLCLPRASVAR